MQSTPKLPTPDATDPEEVSLALEEAIALWATGKKDESIAAVSRAADSAERAGAAPRAAALRAAAGELRGDGASAHPPPDGARSVPPAPRAASHAPPPPSARHAAEARNGARPPAAPSTAKPAAPASVALAPPASAAPLTSTPSSANGHTKVEGSLHVWVRASARDPSLLLVRVLPEGQEPPPGSYEAYLSPTHDGIDLRAPKH